VIHYHGGPITPLGVAHEVWKVRHAFVSFEHPEQVGLAASICQSFALDNGAFSKWKRGDAIDVTAYVEWVNQWKRHPGFDFAVIPDVIDGTEEENDLMFAHYYQAGGDLLNSVPVWHMHESFDRLKRLCRQFKRVALGSSGQWPTPDTDGWWQRMGAAMDAICDSNGQPPCKLHGLRMLANTISSQIPLASADSTNVARNHNRFKKTHGLTPTMAAIAMTHNIEHHATASRWTRTYGHQENMDLLG